MNQDMREAIACAEEAGRFALAELLFQKAALDACDAAWDAAWRRFDAEQREACSPLLAAIYGEMDRRRDASDLVLVLHYVEGLVGTLSENFDAGARREIDPVSAALFSEIQQAARLAALLAWQAGWRLLPEEMAIFTEEERALCEELRQAFREREKRAIPKVCEPPLVSIMIPAYNLPALFSRTMRSAAIQDWPNLEIVVADNSTNEETAAVMEHYASDPRVRYLRNRAARSKEENFAVFEHETRGAYLQWLMQDDILLPGKITQMASVLMENPSVSLVASQRAFIDGRGIAVDEKYADMKPAFCMEEAYKGCVGKEVGRAILTRLQNIIGEPPAVLFRRKDLTHHYWHADCRGYRVISDVVMWLELLARGDLLMFRDPLSCYRRHAGQEGQRLDIILLARLEWIRLTREDWARRTFLQKGDEVQIRRNLILDYEQAMHGISEAVGGALAEQYEREIAAIRQGL